MMFGFLANWRRQKELADQLTRRVREAQRAQKDTPPVTTTDWAWDRAQELRADAQQLIDRKYVARADEQQKAMGLAYVEAERTDLAKEIALFTAEAIARTRVEERALAAGMDVVLCGDGCPTIVTETIPESATATCICAGAKCGHGTMYVDYSEEPYKFYRLPLALAADQEALKGTDVGELVKRLREIANALGWGTLVIREGADTLTALAADNKRLREYAGKLEEAGGIGWRVRAKTAEAALAAHLEAPVSEEQKETK